MEQLKLQGATSRHAFMLAIAGTPQPHNPPVGRTIFQWSSSNWLAAGPMAVCTYKEISRSLSKPVAFYFLGGDPAAPSGTATLLRLSASYQAYPRYRVERQL